eukprot:scpid78741/ scgid24781/ 
MASEICEDAIVRVQEGAQRLEKEVTDVSVDSAPDPCPDGLQEGVKKNIMLTAKLAGTVQAEPPGSVSDLYEANKENRSTAQSQLMMTKADASHLQEGVLNLCTQVESKFTEMMNKMEDMSGRIENLQAQKSALEKLQHEKASRATFKLGDEEHKISSVHQQLEHVEKRLALVQRTHKACQSAVKDLKSWQEELLTKNDRLESRVGEDTRQQKVLASSIKERRDEQAGLEEMRRSVEELSGVIVLRADETHMAMCVTPAAVQQGQESQQAQPAATQAGNNPQAELHIQFKAPVAGAGGKHRSIDSLTFVQANGHPINYDEDISEMLASGDIVCIVAWARKLFRDVLRC